MFMFLMWQLALTQPERAIIPDKRCTEAQQPCHSSQPSWKAISWVSHLQDGLANHQQTKVQAGKKRASIGTEFCKAQLFRGSWLLGCAWLLGLPEVALDGEGINTHGHSLAGNLREALAIRAVLVDSFDHGHRDGAGPITSQAGQFIRLPWERIECPELATWITEQDEEVVGFAFLNLLNLHKQR